MKKSTCRLAMFVLVFGPLVAAQDQKSAAAQADSSPVGQGVDYLLNYLNMAGTMKASDFRPLTQRERTQIYLKTMMNPLGYIKGGFSAGIDHWKDKPPEWEQGSLRLWQAICEHRRPVFNSAHRNIRSGERSTRRQPIFQFWQKRSLVSGWVCGSERCACAS